MKKILLILLSIFMVLSHTACGYFDTFLIEATETSTKAKTSNQTTSSRKTSTNITTNNSSSKTTLKSSSSTATTKKMVTKTNNVEIFVPYNSEQILKTDKVPNNPNTVLTFDVAKGERETAQLIMHQLTNSSLSYNISFSNFACGTSTISSKKMESYVQLYQNVDKNWDHTLEASNSWYPDGIKECKLGWFPDALEPYQISKYYNRNVLDNTHGANQGLFFAIEIDSDTVAGSYEGYLEISFSNNEKLVIKTVINVHDFTLPSENYSKMVIDINTDEINSMYGNKWVTSVYYTKAYDLLLSRGVSAPGLPGSTWTSDELDYYIDRVKDATNNDDVASYFIKFNAVSVDNLNISYQITSTSSKVTTDFENMKIIQLDDMLYSDGKTTILGLKTILSRLVNESTNSVNLLKKATIYYSFADEPGNDYGYIQNILCNNVVELAKEYCLANCDFKDKSEVKEALEDLAYIVTCSPIDRLYNGYYSLKINSVTGDESTYAGLDNLKYKKLNGYCPLYPTFMSSNKSYIKAKQAIESEDYTVWWYGCCQPTYPYASFQLNAPMVISRVNKYQEYYLGIEGQYYYKANAMRDYDGSFSSLTEEEILNGGCNWENSRADGLLIYPVVNYVKEYNNTVSNKVYYYSSLRLENVSEGKDDYNYLHYAYELIENLSNSTLKANYKKQMDALVTSLFDDPASNTEDSSLLYEVRLEIMDLIEELTKIK